jgi:hypothetical protein
MEYGCFGAAGAAKCYCGIVGKNRLCKSLCVSEPILGKIVCASQGLVFAEREETANFLKIETSVSRSNQPTPS